MYRVYAAPFPLEQNVSCNDFSNHFIAETALPFTHVSRGYSWVVFYRADAAAVAITTTDLVSKSVAIEAKVSFHCGTSICCDFKSQPIAGCMLSARHNLFYSQEQF